MASGGHSSLRCAGLSLSRPLLLGSTSSRRAGSVIVAHGPKLLRGTWDLPRPGLEPMSPALAGRFSTTAPPGKPCIPSYGCLQPVHSYSMCIECLNFTGQILCWACSHELFFFWLNFVAVVSLFPDQGSNPCPLQWSAES